MSHLRWQRGAAAAAARAAGRTAAWRFLPPPGRGSGRPARASSACRRGCYRLGREPGTGPRGSPGSQSAMRARSPHRGDPVGKLIGVRIEGIRRERREVVPVGSEGVPQIDGLLPLLPKGLHRPRLRRRIERGNRTFLSWRRPDICVLCADSPRGPRAGEDRRRFETRIWRSVKKRRWSLDVCRSW